MDLAAIGETWDWMTEEINISWSDIFDGWDTIWIDLKEGMTEGLDDMWQSWDDWWGNASPSKRMEKSGAQAVDGWLSSFMNLDTQLLPIMDDIVEAIPAPIRAMFEGEASLGDLATGAATAASESFDGLIEALTGKDAEQNITVVQELDGIEVDKKILKVVGGVVQPLTQ